MTRLCRGCGKRIWAWTPQVEGEYPFHTRCRRAWQTGWDENVFVTDRLKLMTGGGQGPGARVEGNQELSIAPAGGSSESKADLLMRVGWEEYLRLCKETGP